MKKYPILLQFLALLFLCSCSNVLVYYPEKTTYNHPRDYEINYENVFLQTQDGVALHGWWLTPIEPSGKATIIQFHSSEKNISYHLKDSRRFVEAGYNVLLFDYRGFGHSDGYPHKGGLKADGVAAIDFLLDREEVDINKIIILAQAEGAPVALASLGAHGIKPACVVFDNPLYNYEKITEDTVGALPLGKLIAWPASLLASLDDYDPSKDIRSLYGVPVLICHSENNKVISSEHSLSLYKDAFEPKQLYLTHDSGHLTLLSTPGHLRRSLISWRAVSLRHLQLLLSKKIIQNRAGIGFIAFFDHDGRLTLTKSKEASIEAIDIKGNVPAIKHMGDRFGHGSRRESF